VSTLAISLAVPRATNMMRRFNSVNTPTDVPSSRLSPFCESFHLQSSTAVSVTTSMTPISLPIVYQCKRQCASGVESVPQEEGFNVWPQHHVLIDIMLRSESCIMEEKATTSSIC
jgi:hypothetical protein